MGEGGGIFACAGQSYREGGAKLGKRLRLFVRMSGATQSRGFESKSRLYSLLFPNVAER